MFVVMVDTPDKSKHESSLDLKLESTVDLKPKATIDLKQNIVKPVVNDVDFEKNFITDKKYSSREYLIA